MAKFLEKFRKKISEQSKPIKEGIESASKTVGETTSKIAETVSEKGREIASKVSEKTPEIADKSKQIASKVAEKTGEMVTLGKLKIKLHTLNRNAEKILGEIGSRAYELIKKKNKNILADKQITASIESYESILKEIKGVNKEIEELGAKT